MLGRLEVEEPVGGRLAASCLGQIQISVSRPSGKMTTLCGGEITRTSWFRVTGEFMNYSWGTYTYDVQTEGEGEGAVGKFKQR